MTRSVPMVQYHVLVMYEWYYIFSRLVLKVQYHVLAVCNNCPTCAVINLITHKFTFNTILCNVYQYNTACTSSVLVWKSTIVGSLNVPLVCTIHTVLIVYYFISCAVPFLPCVTIESFVYQWYNTLTLLYTNTKQIIQCENIYVSVTCTRTMHVYQYPVLCVYLWLNQCTNEVQQMC